MKNILVLFLVLSHLTACKQAPKVANVQTAPIAISVPLFSADSAYSYVQKQVDFGPRVPNSEAQTKCAAYLSASLKRFGATVVEQKTIVEGFDGAKLNSINVIGSYNPSAKTRVLLLSHWDSRPWADNDPNPANHKKPVMGANDGASGVGVLLEMARQFSAQKPTIGVDLLFVDTEDYGATNQMQVENSELTWCLGTQYWAKNPHVPGYTAKYGILLDMVGGKQATFYREQISDYYAQETVSKVWSQAQSLGFEQFFINQKGGQVTDDHVFINQLAGIPCIDIIQFDPNGRTGFADYWHTVDDTMKNVDKTTLQAVGTTLLHVIYNEKQEE